MQGFFYEVKTDKKFDEAVVDVLKAVEQKGWVVFQIYDIKERLAAKGFQQKPLKIIEICSGKYANALLNKNRLISLCMPCKINVMEDDGVKIVGMRPTAMTQFFPEIGEEDVSPIEKDIKEIIDSAAVAPA